MPRIAFGLTSKLQFASKNQILEKATKDAGMGITFEYTAPGTPQQFC
jgi:hypothetical protein